MILVQDKETIIALKIHIRFQQVLPKRYISCHGVYVTFLQKQSVYVMKRAILARKLGGGLLVLLITFSIFSRHSWNRSNITREI